MKTTTAVTILGLLLVLGGCASRVVHHYHEITVLRAQPLPPVTEVYEVGETPPPTPEEPEPTLEELRDLAGPTEIIETGIWIDAGPVDPGPSDEEIYETVVYEELEPEPADYGSLCEDRDDRWFAESGLWGGWWYFYHEWHWPRRGHPRDPILYGGGRPAPHRAPPRDGNIAVRPAPPRRDREAAARTGHRRAWVRNRERVIRVAAPRPPRPTPAAAMTAPAPTRGGRPARPWALWRTTTTGRSRPPAAPGIPAIALAAGRPPRRSGQARG